MDDPGGLRFVQENGEVFASLFGGDSISAFDYANQLVDRAGLLQGLPNRAANTVEAIQAGQIGDAATDGDDERLSGDNSRDNIVGADELGGGGHS